MPHTLFKLYLNYPSCAPFDSTSHKIGDTFLCCSPFTSSMLPWYFPNSRRFSLACSWISLSLVIVINKVGRFDAFNITSRNALFCYNRHQRSFVSSVSSSAECWRTAITKYFMLYKLCKW